MRQEPLSTWDEDLRDLDHDAFPRARDFAVEATDEAVGDGADRLSWTVLRYLVRSWDLDVVFPWWDRSREQMREWTVADVPQGSIESPYTDRDEGWSLLIWRAGDDVFIMEGDGSEDHDDPPVYQRWFVVPYDLYRSGWEAAIEGFQGS